MYPFFVFSSLCMLCAAFVKVFHRRINVSTINGCLLFPNNSLHTQAKTNVYASTTAGVRGLLHLKEPVIVSCDTLYHIRLSPKKWQSC